MILRCEVTTLIQIKSTSGNRLSQSAPAATGDECRWNAKQLRPAGRLQFPRGMTVATTNLSAGILMYRSRRGELEVLLVHPGGPFWRNKDDGAWSIPKGLCKEGEDPLQAAGREFEEETGRRVDGRFMPLGGFKQSGGKTVTAWAVEGDFDTAALRSNTFSIEWPPRFGRQQAFPEVDRAQWFSPGEARNKLLRRQVPILEALLTRLRGQD
jgi:predicted NUDIX family NTP pyrophosphohydrolase